MDADLPAPDPRPASAPMPVPVPGGPLRALWQLFVPVLAMLVLAATLTAALAGLALWLLRSEQGTAWLLARVPGLELRGSEGALLSDRFAVQRLVVRWDGGQQWVAIDDFVGSGLQWRWHPARGKWLGLTAARLQARRVEVNTGPAGPRPIVMPNTLDMPLRIEAAEAAVAELQIDALPALHQVQAQQLQLWAGPGRGYEAQQLAGDWERARIEGSVSFGALPPYALALQAKARSIGEGAPWSAQLRAQGPLARFEVDLQLQGEAATRGAAAPRLEVQAAITPLQAWPLARLRLLTQALDLQALARGVPRSALGGRIDIDSSSREGPLAAEVEIENARPGRWDQGQLPLSRLRARLRSPGQESGRLLIEHFELALADGAQPAGQWQGSGHWSGEQLQIDSRLEALQPQRLDARAAAMQLSGPLAFTLHGLPAPQPSAPTASGRDRRALAVALRSALQGRIEGSPLPVELEIDAQAAARRLQVRTLRARAGSAQATLQLDAARGDKGAWSLRTQGELADFDPLPWWPGPEASAWRQGRHRLSGRWGLDLTLPATSLELARTAPLALAQQVAGSGSLSLEHSQLAGVPLALHLELGQQPGAAAPARLQAELELGGNRLRVQGRGNPLGQGQDDHLQFELQADQLATLAPLARLVPEGAAWAPQRGSADASLRVDGRWPALRSQGQVRLGALQAGTLAARSASAQWRFDTGSEDPLLLTLDAADLAQGQARLARLQAELRGTWRQHRLELAAALPLGPAPALQTALGLVPGAGSLLRASADGQWSGDGRGGGQWAARNAQLALLPWSGQALEPEPGARAWAQTRDLRLALRLDGSAGLQELQAGAGRLQLADATALRWDEVHVDLSGARAAFALRAEVEPFPLAPLLARWQPTLGWQGDLRLAARVDLRVAETVDAEIAFERRDGDLRLSDENASAPFGLSELRLLANAHGGRWELAGAFAGRTLGEASARLNLHTRPEQRWPDADTAIDGLVQAHVANIGIWGNWLPPGWRLSGQMHTVASVGGRIGAPDYSGEVRADSVAVRNLLLGVDVAQGQALLRLRGPAAEIERFTLRGGEGTAQVGGRIDLSGREASRLTLAAERFRVLGRIDRQLVASGQLTLDLAAGKPSLAGRVRVDEGLFDLSRSDAPTLDDDVVLRRDAKPDARVQAAAPTEPRRELKVAVELDLGDKLRVHGRGLDTTLEGRLLVGSKAGRLTLEGTVNAEGGHYAAYGQKLDIARGLLRFSGDVENPVLDVLALRPNLDVDVGVAITGTPSAPRVRLYADGDMSESDKLSWLVLGRASEGLGRADTALLQRAAVALLAGEGEAPTDTLLRNLGLDSLSVHQTDSGNVRETVVSLGKQLSRRWYVGYERGVNATAGTWQLIYRIAQRFTLRAQSGAENSLDVIWVWRLQGEAPAEQAARPAARSR